MTVIQASQIQVTWDYNMSNPLPSALSVSPSIEQSIDPHIPQSIRFHPSIALLMYPLSKLNHVRSPLNPKLHSVILQTQPRTYEGPNSTTFSGIAETLAHGPTSSKEPLGGCRTKMHPQRDLCCAFE